MSRVAIVCNGTVPGCKVPNGAQGLRALGLLIGLQSAGFSCDIISTRTGVVTQMKRWNAASLRFVKHWRVVPDENMERTLQNEYDIVVFQNWTAIEAFEKSPKNKLVYDFFSASLVEHAFLVTDSQLSKNKERKLGLLAQADVIIGNGTGRTEYARKFIASESRLVDLPEPISVGLGLTYRTGSLPSSPKLKVFLGGFEQVWTRGLGIDDLQRFVATGSVEICAIGVGNALHELSDHGSRKLLPTTPGIVWHEVAPYETYRDLNSQCHVALDVFEENEERRISYSTRAINSICNGCPVITMGFTEIGKQIAEMDAGWAMDSFSVPEIYNLLRRLSMAPEEVAEKARNTRRFWERYCDPISQIEPLATILRELT